MLSGYTYDSQLFTSEAFRKFQNEFIDGNCGVLDGMDVTTTSTTATIADGWAIIKGGLLREQGGTTVSFSNNGYYIIALQIDLSQTNTETDFNQGSFVALRGANDYPTLVQQDLTAGGTMYQMGLAKFQKTDSGISGFTDIRPNLNWTSLYTDYAQRLASIEDLSTVITTAGGKTITGTLTVQGGITGNVTGNVSGSSGSCTGNAATATSAGTCTGNAATATKLATARQINGTNFDGSGNITTSKWGTARTIGVSGAVSGSASVDGSGNVTITTTQANIAVLTGKYAGDGSSDTAQKTISFPSGYTYSNCVVLAYMLHRPPNQTNAWGTGCIFTSAGAVTGDLAGAVVLSQNGITMKFRIMSFLNGGTASISDPIPTNFEAEYRLVLMKIS